MEPNKDYPHSIRVNWSRDHHDTIWWNDTCAMVLEVFGLPGHRFIYRPYIDYMEFEFVSEQDAFICKMLLSDRL